MNASYHIYPCGDHALTIELGDTIAPAINDRVVGLHHFLEQQNMPGIRDLIPSYHTLTLVYDLSSFAVAPDEETAYDKLTNKLHILMQQFGESSPVISRNRQIPVCYDKSLGWDLSLVAATHGFSEDEVIALHTCSTYRVYLLGFLPGFAYMGRVDPLIATPRRSTPRIMVPGGSVGIAGEQTGIYPFDSPGGWQIIGQTPLRLFDALADDPCLLQPGDEVRFYPIDLAEYQQMKHHGVADH